MKLYGDQINQTTLRIAQDWKHLLGGKKAVNGIEADKGREQVLGIKRREINIFMEAKSKASAVSPGFGFDSVTNDYNIVGIIYDGTTHFVRLLLEDVLLERNCFPY
ncbi:hypothetical protein Tco_0144451 [Tanacetum coccineum]